MTQPSPVLITGGAGFIGSAVVRRLISLSNAPLVVVDSLTYAGNLESLAPVKHHPHFRFEQVDICNAGALREVFNSCRPRAVIHLAAESHVDRSIDGPGDFVRTNLVGTYTLLEETRRYWNSLASQAGTGFRFVHVSTDEVFGSVDGDEPAREGHRYEPNSPYAATKAGADHLARAWHRTYGLPTITTYCSNNYGPYQFPEKLIPLMILNALEGKPLPVYGSGENVRNWVHVDDTADALLAVVDGGQAGRSYCVGGSDERRNIDVVRMICSLMDELLPHPAGPRDKLITLVEDRPGHDLRYAMDSGRMTRELGWVPSRTFEDGLRSTVTWYVENREWWERVRSGAYRGGRLGLLRRNDSA